MHLGRKEGLQPRRGERPADCFYAKLGGGMRRHIPPLTAVHDRNVIVDTLNLQCPPLLLPELVMYSSAHGECDDIGGPHKNALVCGD